MYARRSANATRVVLVATSLPCLRRPSPHRAPRQSSCSAGLVRLVAVLPALPRARHRFASPPGIQQQRPLRPSLAFDPCSTPRPLLHVPVDTKFFSETSPRPGYTKTRSWISSSSSTAKRGFLPCSFWMRQVPVRKYVYMDKYRGTEDFCCVKSLSDNCWTTIPCIAPSTTTSSALQVQLWLPCTTTVDPRRPRGPRFIYGT